MAGGGRPHGLYNDAAGGRVYARREAQADGRTRTAVPSSVVQLAVDCHDPRDVLKERAAEVQVQTIVEK